MIHFDGGVVAVGYNCVVRSTAKVEDEVLMWLTGIEMSNFRSIGPTPQGRNAAVSLRPLRRCNIVVGQNNVGKSNVLRAVRKITKGVGRLQTGYNRDKIAEIDMFMSADVHRRAELRSFDFTLRFRANKENEKEAQLITLAGTEEFYFSFTWPPDDPSPKITEFTFADIQDFGKANRLLLHFTQSKFETIVPPEHMKQEFMRYAISIFQGYFLPSVPDVYIIPEFRQILPGDDYALSGTNLIGLLASFQHPEEGHEADRQKFDRIQSFVRRLLHMPDALLEVTHTRDKIMLTHNGLRLPLSYYGTGVHQLVIMITAVLSLQGVIFCIEEPEIHLHPTLQREFIEFITKETQNRYLLSTHSATFINARTKIATATSKNIQVFHLRREEGATIGEAVLEDVHSLVALADLGVGASDILQTSCVIWVEGPSDRIYLNRWIQLIDPSLVEGLHYSIMFYGGRLLSHLSAHRQRADAPATEELQDLIDILRINQHAIVVMDSDRRSRNDTINATKLRVQRECEASGGLCWITDGREVENYLPDPVVIATCAEAELVGETITFTQKPFTKFEEALDRAIADIDKKPLKYAENKPKCARSFARNFTADNMGPQLRERVDAVVDKITDWNS